MTQLELLKLHRDRLMIIPEAEEERLIYSAYIQDERFLWFPDPRMNMSNGSELCIGPDVTEASVELAYRYGIFPWFDYKSPFAIWHAPLDRFVLFPAKIHISHSMRTLMNKGRYRLEINRSFPEVIEACRTVNGRSDMDGAWLSEDIVRVFTALWKKGRAMSVEVRDTVDSERLVGGLYGIMINGCFLGDSMFSFVPSGSKLALIGLCRWMEQNGGKMIDMQIETPHLKSMGGEYLDYYDFLSLLNPEAAATIDPILYATDMLLSGFKPAEGQKLLEITALLL